MFALLSSAAMLLTVIPATAAAVPLPQVVRAAPAGPSADDEAIELQMRLRVLMPALSGDGGG
jgi:hypothetical protein